MHKNVDSVMWSDYVGEQVLFEPGEVHLWRAFFSSSLFSYDRCAYLFSEEERVRGFRFVRVEDQQKFFFSRYVLRTLLSRYLHIAPEKIIFSFGQNGKPFVSHDDVQFNLSHSGNCVLLGVTMQNEIGVDVECIRKKYDFLALAKRFFAAAEFDAIHHYCSEREKIAAFYRCWTRKEAFIKATGLGLSFGLSDFEVSVAEILSDCSALSHVRSDVLQAKKWWLQSISMNELSEDYFAAFAIDGKPSSILCRNFS